MRQAQQLLTDYAAYHRDRRNIASHLVGVPMIVLGVAVLLSRPALDGFPPDAVTLTPAAGVAAASVIWYLTRGSLLLGLATSAFLVLMVAVASHIASGSTALWLASGAGLFIAGWAIQFVGHHWEGRKPAFVDDIVGLMIGPMFVVAELMFHLGWNPALRAAIERSVGPTVLRDAAAARSSQQRFK